MLAGLLRGRHRAAESNVRQRTTITEAENGKRSFEWMETYVNRSTTLFSKPPLASPLR
jgi:hypothetical protein